MSFAIGVVAPLSGVGGGVLFVPLVGGFFAMDLGFVRAAGLFVALSGALAAGPGLLRANLASLRLAIPVALIASICAIAGAMVGLALDRNILQISLGGTILGIFAVMLSVRKSEFPEVLAADRLSQFLDINGSYRETSTGRVVDWKIHRTPLGMCLFLVIGFMAGMFGLGAGWANVPVLNLVMGAPLKIAVGTSLLLLSIVDTSAAWVYLNKGCVVPLIIVPSLVGVMLGSLVGVRILKVAKPVFIRWVVISLLAFSGAWSVYKGSREIYDKHSTRQPAVVRAVGANAMHPQSSDNVTTSAEQLRYARLLEKGTRIGLLFVAVTFPLYVCGVVAPRIPLGNVGCCLKLGVKQYRETAGFTGGWSWVRLVGYGDFMNFVGIVILASVTAMCYLSMAPSLWKRRDRLYAVLAVLQVFVLALAASGLLAGE